MEHNHQIISRKEIKSNEKINKNFNLEIDSLVNKIDKSIEEFKFNVSIAHFYEIYKVFTKYINLELSNKFLKINITKTMKLLLPFVPHLAYDCLERLECKTSNSWPEMMKNLYGKLNLLYKLMEKQET